MWGVVSYISSFISFAEKIHIFEREETEKIVNFFNSQHKETGYYGEESLKRWGLKKVQPKDKETENPHDTWFEISFDAQGNISSGEITQQYTWTKDYHVLQETTKTAVEALAKKMHWENQTHLMGMSLIQHQMVPGKTYSMHFHQDASRNTMVVLLNDEKTWNGGRLKFRSMRCRWIQQTFQPQQGHGILFANEGKQHAVSDMTANSNRKFTEITERTILTIHEKCCTSGESLKTCLIDRVKAGITSSLAAIRSKLSICLRWPRVNL